MVSLFGFEKIFADGSVRNFVRVKRGDISICIGVYPSEANQEGLAEARSARRIGTHLFNNGVPVPEVFGADHGSGLVVFEDCGDVRLYETLVQIRRDYGLASDRIVSLYQDVVDVLVHMQVKGAVGFNKEWCCDTAIYDREVMIKRESEYFLKSFWYDLIGGDICSGIGEEFEEIALQAGTGLNGYFLHRDFQCRNIMVVNGEVRIIDFQAGRLGPPGYDLASLLIDPYSSLNEVVKEKLLQRYLLILGSFLNFDEREFYRQYLYVSLQRNLQILGAFSFLYKKRGKPFFRNFITPSLQMLRRILSESEMKPYVRLRGIAERAENCIERVI
jgi:aminoglycoside/choline kinase family phosphotransferase